MQIIVVYELAGDDIRFRMIIPEQNLVSGIVVLEGQGSIANRNPYSVYGDICGVFGGHDKHDKYLFNITVARCTSGSL